MIDFDKLVQFGYDRQDAAKRFGDDDKLYEECLMTYFAEEDIEKLSQNCREENYITAEKTAHTLKGATGNLSLMPLYQLYMEMVDLFRDGKSADAVALLPRAVEYEREYRSATDYKRRY